MIFDELAKILVGLLRSYRKFSKILLVAAVTALALSLVLKVLSSVESQWQPYEDVANTTLIVGSIALFLIGIAFSPLDFGIKIDPELQSIRAERDELHERIEKSSQPDVKNSILLNLNQLAEYYKINQDQAKSSFRASVFAIIIGLVTIVAGAWIFYLGRSPNLKLTAISTLAGVLSEFIGGAYFVLFNKTSDQSNYLHDRLVRTQDTMLAVSLCGSIEDSSARNDATRDIIATLLERSVAADDHRGPESKKVTRIRRRRSASPNSEQKITETQQ
jgi:hypothetical protein